MIDTTNISGDFSSLNEALKVVLEDLLTVVMWPEIKTVGNDIKIIIDDIPSFRRTLLLKNVDAIPQGKEYYYCENLKMIKKEDNRYCICGELRDQIEEITEDFAMTFEDAEVEIEVFNACASLEFWESPWQFIRLISSAIALKAELPGDYCNEKEKALLPLIKALSTPNYYSEGVNESKTEKLFTHLSNKEYETLWRGIYDAIMASQADYPSKAEVLCHKELLTKVRSDIQTLMEAKGYSGKYPDFVKSGALDGIHVEKSYGMTYFVGKEKRAQYHIHCLEILNEDEVLTIQFLCGTAFLKNDEEPTDVYDCLFNAKGKRLFHIAYHNVPLVDEDNPDRDDIVMSVNIAAKKAECIKLNKAERKCCGTSTPDWGSFLSALIFAGGVFGIIMTLFFMLICCIATAACGLYREIPEMLSTMPWGWILAMAWIGFGGTMGIVEVLSINKT